MRLINKLLCSLIVLGLLAPCLQQISKDAPKQDSHEPRKTSNSTAALDLESDLLRETILLYQKKLSLVEELKRTYLENNVTLEESEDELVNFSLEMIRKDEIQFTKGGHGNHREEKVEKRNEKQEVMFLNKFLKRQSQEISNYTIRDIQYLNTKQYKTSNEMSAYLIIVLLTTNNRLLLFDIGGKLIEDYDPGHDVYRITTGPHTDEIMISTLGYDYTIRNHLVEHKRVKINGTENQTERNLTNNKTKPQKSQVKTTLTFTVTLESSLELKFPDFSKEAPVFTMFLTYMIKGTKYFIMGDTDGFVSVYFKNGTLKGSKDFQSKPVIFVQKHYPNILVASPNTISFFNPVTMSFTGPGCDKPNMEILDLIVDSTNSNIIFALLQNLEILVYETKSSQSSCRVINKLNSAIHKKAVKHQSGFRLHTAKYHLILHDTKKSEIKVFNLTDFNPEEAFQEDSFIAEVHPRTLSDKAKLIYNFQKNTMHSFYMTVVETDEGRSNSSFHIYEFLTPQKAQSDWFSNMRFPIILLSIIFAIGYQMWNRKRTKSSNEFDRLEDIDKKLEGLKKSTEKSLGSLGGAASRLRGSDDDSFKYKGGYAKDLYDDDGDIPKRKKF